ncbi:MAG: serine/threonine protein kinase, partial [Thermoanaerobaculia bacterium]|nr:serine/threonine protein kinase [Thermoanaerobaculia bacterium]
ETGEIAICRQAIMALEKLASQACSEEVIEALAHVQAATDDPTLRSQAESAIQRLEERFHGTRAVVKTPVPEGDDMLVDLSTIEPAPTIIDARTLRPGDVLADRYKMIRQVGKGGFGVVVLVEDRIVQDEIILKFLGPKFALDRGMIERFKHELRLARKITHQNVIRIYDLISFGHSFAISMEYFDSHSLATELRGGLPIETRRGLRILRDIASGLAVAHRAGIIHRDLKPGNILINDQLEVKLVDFGLAAAASQPAGRLTRSGSLIGTPAYMSPEQIRDHPLDPRSDVYSLGIVMYEIFTGRPPYRNADTMAVLFQHVEGKATPPREVNPKLSPTLEAMILRAIAVDPAQRYQSAAELELAIQALPELAQG